MSATLRVTPGGALRGDVRVPGDKSISHRSVMFGSLASGETRVRGCLMGEDVRATMNAFRAMGVTIEESDDGLLIIDGAGLHGLTSPTVPLDLGNSGTSTRLLTGILAGAGIEAVLIGDASLSGRPMGRVVTPLTSMGASIDTAAGGTPPLRIHAGHPLHGIDYVLPVASAQVKSAVLLAGLFASGSTTVVESAPTRDHTERMLRSFGVEIALDAGRATVAGGQTLRACAIDVPADISSAAFFAVGAAMTEGSDITLRDVLLNPTRTGVLEILRAMGASIEVTGGRTMGAEPVGDVRVRGGALSGIEIPAALVPSAIDEFPILFVAAACASGG